MSEESTVYVVVDEAKLYAVAESYDDEETNVGRFSVFAVKGKEAISLFTMNDQLEALRVAQELNRRPPPLQMIGPGRLEIPADKLTGEVT